MSTTLDKMTAAELVAELAKHRNTKDLGIRLAMIGIRAELDARCEKWRIGLNADGDLVMGNGEKIYIGRQMNGAATVRELSEFRALLGYLEQRGKGGSGLRVLETLADENLQRVMGDDTKGGGNA